MSSAPPPPDDDAKTPPADPTEGLVKKIVIATIAGGLVFAALALYSDAGKLLETAADFSVPAFLLGLALATVNYGLRILRWQYYLKHLGIHIPLGESSRIFLSGFVMSVTPGKLGEVLKSLLLFEAHGTPIARTAPIVVAERLTDLIALVLLTALGSLAFAQGPLLAAAGGVLVLSLLMVCAYRPLGELALRGAARLPLLGRISDRLRDAYDALHELTRPAPLLIGSAIAVLAWGLECVAMFVIVHGFDGIDMAWDATTFAYSASTIVGAVAMMPGGLGVTEVGMTGLLQTLGGPNMTMPVATATTILVRIATLWWAVALGAVALALHRVAQRGRT